MTRISIITPSYNQAAFLEDTLRSVLRQEGIDLEYILVDGASQDGSLEIIHRYADRLARWVSEPDKGQAEAINKGLQHASGEIVAWLNSDDLYLPGAVARAVACLEENPDLGMVYGDALTIDASGRPLNSLVFGQWGLRELMAFRIICQPAVFMRRSWLEAAGRLDPTYHFMLDHQLWIRIASLAPVQHVPELWAAARHHPGAKNVAQAAGFGKEALRILEWMENEPRLADQVRGRRREILAGAHRLDARYLLDGGQPGPALRAYGRALRYNPRFAIRHWHRMVYALLSLTGLAGLSGWYYRLAPHRSRVSLAGLPGISEWPGITLQ